MTILNLTQHVATSEQVAQGVQDLPDWARQEALSLLTFDAPPDVRRGRWSAGLLAQLCQDIALEMKADSVMIAPGAIPMFVLAEALADVGLRAIDPTGEDLAPWEV
jgi:hypothetical protein